MKIVNGATSENTATFFVDIEGDIFEHQVEASVCGIAGKIVVDSFFVGSLTDMMARALRIYNAHQEFKVGYYQADTINGVHFIGEMLLDDDQEIDRPDYFEMCLKDLGDDEIVVAHFDQCNFGLLAVINAEYGINGIK